MAGDNCETAKTGLPRPKVAAISLAVAYAIRRRKLVSLKRLAAEAKTPEDQKRLGNLARAMGFLVQMDEREAAANEGDGPPDPGDRRPYGRDPAPAVK